MLGITNKHKILLALSSLSSFMLFKIASNFYVDNVVYQNSMDIFSWLMPFIITCLTYNHYLNKDTEVVLRRNNSVNVSRVDDCLQTVVSEIPIIDVNSEIYNRMPHNEKVIYVYGVAEEEII